MDTQDFDTIVVGAGFGGLGAALRLVEGGQRVLLAERLDYPGGCASTFRRDGYAFEAGATLFSGFGPGELFDRWIRDHALDVELDWLDPVVELRAPGLALAVPRDRAALIARFQAMPGAPREALARFFELQAQVADALWSLFRAPELLPPLGLGALLSHLRRSPSYLPILRWLGRPLGAVLEHQGLARFEPLRVFLDAVCQITIQCGVAEAEAPFALASMDYFFRGTAHVRGGIGRLASGLLDAVARGGGSVELANRVRAIERDSAGFTVETRRGARRARNVVLNLLPHAAARLLRLEGNEALAARQRRVESGWGAAMLYRVVRPPADDSGAPRHFQLVMDPARGLSEGHHLFVSISGAKDEGRAPPGLRTMTVSTHVDLGSLRAWPEAEQAARVASIQARMRENLARALPEWSARVHELPASPRTFERFTGRSFGYVGGVPRRHGLWNYADLGPAEIVPGAFLVGDSVFPGQSTLATALGGGKTAEVLLSRRLSRPASAAPGRPAPRTSTRSARSP